MTVQTKGEDVYASILLTDTYLPGALVLAHSLRDAGTKKKLAILVTPDTVSPEVITQLKTVYDYIIPVERIRNDHPANLYLMNRPDLHSAFTKIALWKQTQFRKIVYIDADVVAYRAPDELFELPHAFSAAPDIGWPDIFNTGVMVLSPNMGDYYAMMAMAERGISFDGADQGLLNMHFKNSWNRLPFTYNVTPSAHYQYVPAYLHFQSSISMIHFIGADKPWKLGRSQHVGNNPYDEMIGRWWAVYDRHYHPNANNVPDIVRYFVKGEFDPTKSFVLGANGSWDAQKNPPPPYSKPEGYNLPQTYYAMSSDPTPFVTPDSAHYENTPKPIFPWEMNRSRPKRVFGGYVESEPAPATTPAPKATPKPVATPRARSPVRSSTPKPSDSDTPRTPSPARRATPGPTPSSARSDAWNSATPTATPGTTATTPVAQHHSSVWNRFTNVWDDIPEITRYIEALQSRYRRSRSRSNVNPTGTTKVTEFPSEDERPSLPVTPAPIKRTGSRAGTIGRVLSYGEDEKAFAATVPSAPQEWVCVHGVQWSPADCPCELLQKANNLLPGREFGAEPVHHKLIEKAEPERADTATPIVSPMPVKPVVTTVVGKGLEPSPVDRILSIGNEEEVPASPTIAESWASRPGSTVPLPSYAGPGPMFEKGEVLPMHAVGSALPSDEVREELDV